VLIQARLTLPDSWSCNIDVRLDRASGAPQLLEAFYYGRAFAITVNKRIGEALTDVVAEISKIIAENPMRLQEFQVSESLGIALQLASARPDVGAM
jgi:hypothetical protein